MRRWLAGGLTTVQPKASMRKHQPVGLSLGSSYIKATELTRLRTKMVSGHTHVPEMEAMCCLSHFPAPATALQGVTWPKMELAIFHHILPKAEEAPQTFEKGCPPESNKIRYASHSRILNPQSFTTSYSKFVEKGKGWKHPRSTSA